MGSLPLLPWLHHVTPLPVVELFSKEVDAGAQNKAEREEDCETDWAEFGKHRIHPLARLRVDPQDPADVSKATCSQQGESRLP